MDSLSCEFQYEWEPFTAEGRHLTFEDHRPTRLMEGACSHWGPAVYKWEGMLSKGEQRGKVGILIGETGKLRQRIKQYISGTQKSGNLYWRENFLTQGDIHLYVLRFIGGIVNPQIGNPLTLRPVDVSSNNMRLVLEQLLVMKELALGEEGRWIVNRKQ